MYSHPPEYYFSVTMPHWFIAAMRHKEHKGIRRAKMKKDYIGYASPGSLQGHLVMNIHAPVRAYDYNDTSSSGETRDFKDLAAFLEWFRPRFHNMVGPPITSNDYTDVLLENMRDHDSFLKSKRIAKAPRVDKPPRVSNGGPRGGYPIRVDGKEVYSSIAKAFVACGWPADSKTTTLRLRLKVEKKIVYRGIEFEILENNNG